MVAWHRTHEKTERHRTAGREVALSTWLDAGNAGCQVTACGLDHFAQRRFQDRERHGVHPRFSASLLCSNFWSRNCGPVSEDRASLPNPRPGDVIRFRLEFNDRDEMESTEKLEAPAMTERLAYSIQESADMLGVNYFSVYRLIQRGKLKACRALRGKLLVPRTELLKLLKTDSQ